MRDYNFFTLLLLFLFSHISYAEVVNNFVNTYWVFDDVSKIDAYGKNNGNTRKALKTASKQVVIAFTNDAIIIHNNLLSNQAICNKRYAVKTKTPLNYFYSEKTVNLYNAVLAKENDVFANQIETIKTGLNDSCPSPYEELIENNGRLIAISDYYLVFFKRTTKSYLETAKGLHETDTTIDNSHTLATELNTRCKNTSNNSFTDNYICQYPSQIINDVYLKIIKIDEYNSQFLRKTLPKKNITYHIASSDVTVKYVWKSKSKLVVSLNFAGGVTTLIFKETNGITELIYRAESDS